MNYIYYKDKKGNFGDDLNPWLWSQLFQDSGILKKSLFMGIGSILNHDYKEVANKTNPDIKKIVFGTGVRPGYEFPHLELDETWDVRFLRGPLSSFYFHNKYTYIADAAYAIRLLPTFNKYLNTKKKYEISFMPYYKSVPMFDWTDICNKLGIHYISPYSENGVENTILEIASSEKIITEAMHGAIIADTLRVPWHRFILTTPHTEGPMVSEFKWNDWLMSLDLANYPEYSFVKLYRSGRANEFLKKLTLGMLDVSMCLKWKMKDQILKSLSSEKKFDLSSEQWVKQTDNKLKEQIEILNNTKE